MLHLKITRDAEIMRKTARNSNIILIIATVLGFITAIIAAFYISKSITLQVGGEPTEIAKITEQVAAGNLDIQTKTATGIYASIQLMIEHLQVINYEKEQQDWLKTGQAQINEKTSGEQDIITLAKNIISYLTTYVAAQVGLFYLVQSDSKLKIIASYAYTMNANTPNEFNFGESLVGQAALEQKIISITQTPAECPLIIRSGLTGSLPQYVLLLPFLYENKLKGIIEIGSTKKLTEIQRSFLELVMPNIGVAVNTADSRTKMKILLEQSQQQSD
ncbi:MAG: GAF domain-containing protein, partial [Proteobacteria bacterium]|nr:GAF domain-containing protein [Pseudomonadota bacterium]